MVTAAPLPSGWTRFDLRSSPLGTPSPVSHQQLIQSAGTTYTFTVTDDERGASLITFELAAARSRRLRPGLKPELGDVVVTTQFVVPTLRYNLLDTTGAATTPGSYAFLQTAGDATSATDNFGNLPFWGVELRIHPTDARGVSRSALYATVRVGDRFDYQTDGSGCGFRFQVTSVDAAGTPVILGIEYVADYYSGRCVGFVDDPGAALNVGFVWRVRPGILGPDGVRTLILDEIAGEGTYRLHYDEPWVGDVPAGAQVILAGIVISDSVDASSTDIQLYDAATRSALLSTCQQARRVDATRSRRRRGHCSTISWPSSSV